MKKLLVLLLCLIASPTWAAIARVQFTNGGTTSGTSTSVTITGVSNPDLLVFIVATSSNSTALTSVTDTNGTPTACIGFHGANNAGQAVYYETSAASGSHQFSVTDNGSAAGIRLYAAEYSGADPASACYTASVVATGTSTSPASASVTPLEIGDLAVGAIANSGSTATYSGWGSPLVQVDHFTGFGDSSWADAVLSSTSAVSTSATLSASVAWAASIALFKPSSGGSTGCKYCMFLGNRPQAPIDLASLAGASLWQRTVSMEDR